MPNLIPHWIHERMARQDYRGTFHAAAMFVDVSGFTPLTEALMYHPKEGAETLTVALNRIFYPLVQMVYAHGGFVTTFAGDAFTALFPQRRKEAALHAAQSALFVQRFFGRRGQLHTAYGDFSLVARVGLSAGQVRWGIAGQVDAADRSQALLAYFFRGKAVDACARAEHQAGRGQIVADERFLGLLPAEVEAAALPTPPGYFSLQSAPPRPPLAQFTIPAVPVEGLQPFVLDAAVRFSVSGANGEFRQVAPAFISFQERHAEQLNAFVAVVAELARDYGGYFNKMDFGDKGGVMLVLFGAPVAHENDLVRAADFLLALRDRTASSNQPAFRGLQWRAGLSFGTAYAGLIGGLERSEYTAIGTVVNLAARLMQGAPWGTVWLTSAAAHHARRDLHCEPAGTHHFKGFAEPQPVHALHGRQAARGGELHEGGPAMLDRERELARLYAFVEPLSSGHLAGMLTVVGEMGIGKSRLLQEFRATTRFSPPSTFARCPEEEARPLLWFSCVVDEVLRQPLNPFRYALRNYFRQVPTDAEADNKARFERVLEGLVQALNPLPTPLPSPQSGEGRGEGGERRGLKEALAAELSRTRPFLGALVDLYWPGSLYDQVSPQLRFENTLSALATLFRAESLRQPVAVQIEDLQWLDGDSRLFLQYFSRSLLADRREHYPIAILATAREVPPAGLLDPAMPRETLLLDPLPAEAVAALAGQVVQAPVSPELVQLLAERAEGNPFFVEQLLRYLQEQGLLLPTPEGLRPATAELVLPADVRAVLAARLDQLPPDVRRVVQVAAALGRYFEVPVLQHMLRGDPMLPEQLAHGRREEIWFALDETRYAFRQALLRDVAYEMQLRPRLRDLHGQALASLEAVYADELPRHYDELAYHARHSGNPDKQREYYRKAGESAQAAYMNAAALDHYERLLPLLSTTAEQADIRLRLGTILEITGPWSAAESRYREALALAEEAGNAAMVANCQHALGTLLRQGGDYEQGRRFLEQARRGWGALGDRAGLCRTLTELGGLFWRQREFEQAGQCLAESLRLARELGDRRSQALALNQLGNLAWSQRDFTAARILYEETLELHRQLGDKRDLSGTLNNLAVVLGDLGEYAASQPLQEESLALRREVGDKHGIAMSLNNMGWYAKVHGDYDQARGLLEEYLLLCREIGDRSGLAIALNNLGLVVMWQGDLVAAQALFQENLDLFRDLDYQTGIVTALGNLGVVKLELGDLVAAARLLAESLVQRQEIQDRGGMIFPLIGLAGVAGRQAKARPEFERLGRLVAFIETLHYPGEPEPVYVRLHEQVREQVRAALGKRAAAAAEAQGRAMTLEDAVVLALASAG